MPISPQKALGDKRQREVAKMEQLDALISKELTEHYDGRGAVTIDRPKGYSQFVMDAVIKEFRGAGWIVEQKSSPKNEDYITFKPEPETLPG